LSSNRQWQLQLLFRPAPLQKATANYTVKATLACTQPASLTGGFPTFRPDSPVMVAMPRKQTRHCQ